MKFNVSGTTPAERNRAILLPIYKKEGRKDPDNYTSKTNQICATNFTQNTE